MLSTSVNNGGTAAADRGSGSYSGDPSTNDLSIGLRTSPAPSPPYAIGTVELIDVNLTIDDVFSLGVVDTVAGAFHNAAGTLISISGVNADGDLSVSGDSSIGRAVAGPAGTTATGVLDLSGALTCTATGDLMVGRTAGSGNADGSVSIAGNLVGFLDVSVGGTDPGSTGSAQGFLSLDQSLATAGRMVIAVSGGAGAAMGTVELNESLVNLAADLTLGPGSGLIVQVDGLSRGTDYGAIDAATAALDGTIDILFEFAPPPGSHSFDLIRATDSGSAIVGNFAPGGVTVSGLAASYTVTTGIVPGTVGGQPASIFRVTVSSQGAASTIPFLGWQGRTLLCLALAAAGILVLRRAGV